MEPPSTPVHRLLGLCLLLLLGTTSHAAPGDLDSLDLNVVGSSVVASAVQPDGKMIIAGSFTSVLGAARNNIARINADGTLDAGFNPIVHSTINCVAVQADGKILLGGDFPTVNGTYRPGIARINADGTLDTGFNPDLGSTVSMAVQTDGKILLVGYFTKFGGWRRFIVRVEADGTLDAGFDPNPNDFVTSVAVQADGKILLGGQFTKVGGTTRNSIARVDANGTLDANFNPDASGPVSCMAVQADGQILLGGTFTGVGGTTRNRIARVGADGTLDESFNPNANDWVSNVAVQADGRILIAGNFTNVGGETRNRIARVESDGGLDEGFNPNCDNRVDNVMVQADGKIMLGGIFFYVGGSRRQHFARLLNDPAIQTLSAVDGTQVRWTRGGSAPEIMQTTFELSTDGGSSYTPLGMATRVGGTANWQLTGVNLPDSGHLRARGRTTGGRFNGSSGLAEQVIGFSGLQSPVSTVTLVTPTFGSTEGGTSVTIIGTNFTGATSVTFGGIPATSFTVDSSTQITATVPAKAAGTVNVGGFKPDGSGIGTMLYTYVQPPTVNTSTAKLPSNVTQLKIIGAGFSSMPGNNTVVFSPSGSGMVTAATGTSLTVTGISGLTPGALNVVVTSDGVSSGDPVQVATVVVPGPGDVSTFDASVIGSSVGTIAVQPDGKTLIAGSFTSVMGEALNYIARLNADGTLDAGFNPQVNGSVSSVAVQADGKILLGGSFTSVGGITRNRIARVAANGTPDMGFNPNANGSVFCVALQADGQILLGGNFTTLGGTARNRIARVRANGSLDANFNPDASGNVSTLALQHDGQILFGGDFTNVGGSERNYIARVAADGALDMGFNPNPNALVTNVVVQADGKILLGGFFGSLGGTARDRIARLAANGTLDESFNLDVNDWISSVAIQADGKILLAGRFTSIGGTTRNHIARVASDGSLDEDFDPNASSDVFCLALQADGKILLGGDFSTVGEIPRNRLAQLLNDPATQTLSVVDSTQVLWTRGGSAPEITLTTFELSTDGGVSYSPLGGMAARAGSTANWKLSGLNLPASGWLRARGRNISDAGNGSLVEQMLGFSELEPPVAAVTQVMPDIGSTGGGTRVTITGTNFTGTTGVTFGGSTASFTVDSATQITAITPAHVAGPVDVRVAKLAGAGVGIYLYTYVQPPTVTASTARLPNNATILTISGTGFSTKPGGHNAVAFLPTGTGTVITATTTGLTVTGISGLTLGALSVVVSSDGISSNAATQVATVVMPGPGDVSALNANVIGDVVHTSAVQSDGKIIIAGTFTSVLGQPRKNIARLNADGTLDVSFNPDVNGTIYSVAMQTDGKILLGGHFTTVGGIERNFLGRLAADGTLDVGFNPNPSSIVTCLAVQSDGKILLGGYFSSVGSTFRQRIARVTTDGSVDTGFGLNTDGYIYCMAVQADGEILLGGHFTSIGGISRNRIARVNANGSLAMGFNPNASGIVRSLAVQADGKIILGGDFTSVSGIGRNCIARVEANGTLDMNFNPDANGSVISTAVQADGMILLGGEFTTLGGLARNYVARVAADGTLDEDFNPSANNLLSSLVLQADGNVLLGGKFTTVGRLERNLFARILNDPAMQTISTLGNTQVLWSRGSSAPEISQTTFELSTDGGSSYTPLGTPTRVSGTANWQLTGMNLPVSGRLRARGRTIGGYYNGSSSLVEQVARFGVLGITSTQNLAFTPPAKLHLSEGPLTLAASASSGLPVIFSVISGPATVLGSVLTLTGPGAVKVRASQSGNADFLAAVPVERTITVAANPTTLTLANLSQTYTGTPRPITVLGITEEVSVTYKVGSSFASDAPTHVGSYPVKAVAGGITKTGTLVITKAPLFVQPHDQRKFAGQMNPALGFAYSGFLGGDNATNSVSKAPTVSTTATATSAGGLYPITSKGGASANYLFFHQKGTMKVETFAASYEALLVDAGGQRPSAKLELTVAASSKAFSGKLTTPTETSAMPLKGTLTTNTNNETASGTATVKKGENTYLVEFTLPLAGDFTATAKRNGAALGGPTSGSKLMTVAKGQTLSYSGTHSALLAPATALVGVPAGAGWAVATIDAKGLLKLTGKLADGAGLTASLAADASPDPGYRLLIQPYTPARTGSYLAGAFNLKPQTDEGLIGRRYVAFEDAAAFTWVKAERQQDSSYRAGFGPVDTRFTLDPWLPPAPAKGLVPAITLAQRLGLSSPANQFSVEHSSISSASYSELPTTLALPGTTSSVSIIAPSTTPANRTKWKIMITPATGAFVGSFELVDEGKKRSVPFTGILRQPPSTDTSGLIGDGNFQLPSLLPAPDNEIMSGEVGFER